MMSIKKIKVKTFLFSIIMSIRFIGVNKLYVSKYKLIYNIY